MSDIHNRLTSRLNAHRLELEIRRAVAPAVVVAIAAILSILGWSYLVGKVGRPDGGSSMLTGGTYQVQFAVNDAEATSANRSNVTFEGIPAGRVTGVQLEGGQAILTASIYKTFGPLYRDAHAALRPVSALQNMYLDITSRGTPASGSATRGGPLPAAQTQTSVPISNVLDTFQPSVRAHLSDMLSSLGAGLADHGDALRAAFVKLVPFIDVVWRMSQQLSIRRAETRQLVSNFGTLMGDLGQRSQQLRRLVSEGGTMFGALATSSPNLDATLREFPPTLADINSSFSSTRAVLPSLDRALQSLEPVANALPQGLSALRRLSATARPAVDALQRPVQRLVPFAQAVQPTSAGLQSMAAALNPQTGAINHITTSIAGCPKALYGFFQWTPSVFSVEDARGVTVRGDLALGFDSAGGVQDPNVYTPASCAPGTPYPGRP